MKVRFFSFHFAMAILVSLMACTDDTSTVIGGNIMPSQDFVSTDQAYFSIRTQSVKTGAISANTNRCYIGSVIDPITGALTTSSFLAQFHIPEDYVLPEKTQMMTDAGGKIVADSCVLRVLHEKYFGDSLATMKLYVQELDTNRVMSEATTYYTDIDPNDFLSTTTLQRKMVTYSALDQSKSETVLNNRKIYRDITVRLTPDFGSFILNKYYENPQFFKNSYEFAKHVCAGFYFKHAGGVGVMIDSELTTMDIYYRRHSQTKAGKDTIVSSVMRVAATEEVLQNSRVDNEIPAAMLNASNNYTYLKSPAGIHTELTLPVGDIVSGKHYSDTINSAKFTIRGYNTGEGQDFVLPVPESVLLLPASQRESFFREKTRPDNILSYMAVYADGGYTFNNIAPLISALRAERDRGAGVTAADDDATRQIKWKAWESAHPDWNKLVLLPVTGEYITTKEQGTNREIKVLQRLRNSFGLSCIKLEGGADTPIQLSVIFSRFQQ